LREYIMVETHGRTECSAQLMSQKRERERKGGGQRSGDPDPTIPFKDTPSDFMILTRFSYLPVKAGY
jgi:hypothetical protein